MWDGAETLVYAALASFGMRPQRAVWRFVERRKTFDAYDRHRVTSGRQAGSIKPNSRVAFVNESDESLAPRSSRYILSFRHTAPGVDSQDAANKPWHCRCGAGSTKGTRPAQRTVHMQVVAGVCCDFLIRPWAATAMGNPVCHGGKALNPPQKRHEPLTEIMAYFCCVTNRAHGAFLPLTDSMENSSAGEGFSGAVTHLMGTP
ncbi:hypothetical protein S40285_10066 [Stachybotrys chlorohalonatus IBT 40285]|uniref:Uncharacterized protein n=1 Tax=Stachybotrys chlorohalonatus (strain IBT 40285) TaxID=1283841 RepID=A0A084QMC4_STAC4|nr:hypothetical protein S40285_10066 [Stachybotrys chlorohalonata IBT 40285]